MRADPRWLFSVVEDGVVAVGAEQEVEVDLDAPFERRRRLLELLVDGAEPASVADAAQTDRAEAEELLDRLRDVGALTEPGAEHHPSHQARLGEAIIAAEREQQIGRYVWTADELLVLPERTDPALLRRTLRAFIAGLASDPRLRAYCYVATWLEPTAWGDSPGDGRLEAARLAAEDLDPTAVHVIDLEGDRAESVPADRVDSLGAEAPHRLGTVLAESTADLPGGLHHGIARYAVANLRFPTAAHTRLGRGTAPEPERAPLIARAEAAERYGATDIGHHQLVRAREYELEGAVSVEELFHFNRRQLSQSSELQPPDPDTAYLWVKAATPDGSPRWIPAQMVFLAFADLERGSRLPSITTSSGVAAHTDRRDAVERAFGELIERDAFMWHWVQRVSRERIDPHSLPPQTRKQLAGIEAEGLEAHMVNLTLDTRPVILCLLVGKGWIVPGAASRADPESAANKALSEAWSVAWTAINTSPEPQPIQAEEVRTPIDHLHFHRQPEVSEQDRFLFSSPEMIRLDEIEAPPGPVEEAVATVGEPLIVELGSSATDPFRVVRAVVPGMVPISFGFDREPLGVPRLAEPQTALDGRLLGDRLELEDAGPLIPHAFA